MRILALYGVLITIPTLYLFISQLQSLRSMSPQQNQHHPRKQISQHKLSPIINTQDQQKKKTSNQQQKISRSHQNSPKSFCHIWAIVSGCLFTFSSVCFWISKFRNCLSINDAVQKFQKFHITNFAFLGLYLLLPFMQLVLIVGKFIIYGKIAINTQSDIALAIVYALSIIFGNQFLVIAIDALRNLLQKIQRMKLLRQLKRRQQIRQRRIRQNTNSSRALNSVIKSNKQEFDKQNISISDQPIGQFTQNSEVRSQLSRNFNLHLNFTESQYQEYYTKAVLIAFNSVFGFCIYLVFVFSHTSCVFLGTLLSVIVYHAFTLEERASRMINISWLAVWGVPLSIFLAYCIDFYEKQCYRLVFYLIGYAQNQQKDTHRLNPTPKNNAYLSFASKSPVCFFEFSDHLCALFLIYLLILNIKKMIKTAKYIRINSEIRRLKLLKASEDKQLIAKFEALVQKVKKNQAAKSKSNEKNMSIINQQLQQLSCLNPEQEKTQQNKDIENFQLKNDKQNRNFSQCTAFVAEKIQCSICHVEQDLEISDGDCSEKENLLIPLKCGHYFHEDCLRDWFKQKISCPNCRQVNHNII